MSMTQKQAVVLITLASFTKALVADNHKVVKIIDDVMDPMLEELETLGIDPPKEEN